MGVELSNLLSIRDLIFKSLVINECIHVDFTMTLLRVLIHVTRMVTGLSISNFLFFDYLHKRIMMRWRKTRERGKELTFGANKSLDARDHKI